MHRVVFASLMFIATNSAYAAEPTPEQIAAARSAVEKLGGRFDGPLGVPGHQHLIVTLHKATDDDLKNLPQMPLPFELVLGPKVTEECFAELKRFDTLTVLHLRGAGWTGKKWEELGKLEHLTELHVNIAKNLGDVDWKPLSRLTSLSLTGTAVTGVGFKDLPNLRSLHLQGSKINDAGLAEIGTLKNLTTLDLDGTPVTDEGLKELAGLDKLATLSLEFTAVTGSGFNHFKGNKTLTNVMMNRGSATDEGMKGVKELAGLQHLRVMYTKVGDAGIMELTGLTDLKSLLADDSKVTLAGADRFRKARPKCEVFANGRGQ